MFYLNKKNRNKPFLRFVRLKLLFNQLPNTVEKCLRLYTFISVGFYCMVKNNIVSLFYYCVNLYTIRRSRNFPILASNDV